MDEEQEEVKQEPDTTTEDSEVRDKPKAPLLVVEANSAAERLEEANKKREELLDRQEEMMAKSILGGQAEAGIAAAKKEPDTDLEYSQKLLRGEVNPLGDDGFI